MRAQDKMVVALLLVFASFMSSGCEILDSATGSAQIPTMEYKNTALLKSPTTGQVASYFCPAALGEFACTSALGASPAKEDLRFDFELTFGVNNPNTIPIPTISMLLATTLFPTASAEELGAVCVTFCDPGEEGCTGQGAKEDCRADDQDQLDSFDDFLDKTTENLVNVVTGVDNPYDDNVSIKTIPANGSKDIKVVFTLGVDPMTNILSQVAGQYVDSFVSGATDTSLEVPYSMRGTLWFDLPFNYGRFGAGFGPYDDLWSL